MPREQVTAIIVNARGEVFTGWAMAISYGVSGGESFYRVPQFAKTKTLVRTEDCLWPSDIGKRGHYTINKPYVFSCREYAEKAASKMYAVGRIAVVT